MPALYLRAANGRDGIQSTPDAGDTRFSSKPVQLNLLIEMVLKMQQPEDFTAS